MRLKRIFSIIGFSLATVLGFTVLFIFLNIKNYYSLKGEELIGIVHCERGKTKISLKFERIIEGKTIRRVNYAINSDKWVLTVEVLKWPDFSGLTPVYRVARIASRDKNGVVNSDRIDPGSESLWSFLIKYPKIIPFLQAIRGEVSLPIIEETTKYYIYIRKSGLMVERKLKS